MLAPLLGHSIKGVEIEVQEALPKPSEETKLLQAVVVFSFGGRLDQFNQAPGESSRSWSAQRGSTDRPRVKENWFI